MPTLHECWHCGALTPSRNHCARPQRSKAEARRRAMTVEAWRRKNGDWCPGWRRDGHDVEPPNVLTADHVIPVALGGREGGELQVLCRKCNSAKADRGVG